MDKQALKIYNDKATGYIEQYESCEGGISVYFSDAFCLDMKILDIGCGYGRDLRILHEMGFQADGVDPCETQPTQPTQLTQPQPPQIDNNAFRMI